jgi:phosphatidylserine decarboxylase
MTVKAQIFKIFEHEDVNFLLTNRIPRRLATQFIGWFSRIEQPLVRDLSIAAWRLFADLDLSEAKKEQLKDGVRPIDQRGQILVSPCDAIVGACGKVAGTELYQAKGFPYALGDLLCDEELVEAYRDGCYATLRLKSSMYHRFHAPHDGRIERVRYISGDTWNVNPIALKRIERLFCKNERAALTLKLALNGQVVTLVAIAAILVASIRLHCLAEAFNRNYRGRSVIDCERPVRKGEELGWFEHGSTIIMFAPDGFALCEHIRDGAAIRVGEPLMRLP